MTSQANGRTWTDQWAHASTGPATQAAAPTQGRPLLCGAPHINTAINAPLQPNMHATARHQGTPSAAAGGPAPRASATCAAVQSAASWVLQPDAASLTHPGHGGISHPPWYALHICCCQRAPPCPYNMDHTAHPPTGLATASGQPRQHPSVCAPLLPVPSPLLLLPRHPAHHHHLSEPTPAPSCRLRTACCTPWCV